MIPTGTITIAADGTATGSGLAFKLYQTKIDRTVADWLTCAGPPTPAQIVTLQRRFALECIDNASGVSPFFPPTYVAGLRVIAPPASGPATVHTSFSSSTSEITAQAFVSAGVAGLKVCPRQLRFTIGGSTPSDAPPIAKIYGENAGQVVTEVLSLPSIAAGANSLQYYDKVTRVLFVAGSGTGATIEIGFTDALGLSAAPFFADPALMPVIFQELVDGSPPSPPGFLKSATASPPYGAYFPGTGNAPDGAHSYVVRYEATTAS